MNEDIEGYWRLNSIDVLVNLVQHVFSFLSNAGQIREAFFELSPYDPRGYGCSFRRFLAWTLWKMSALHGVWFQQRDTSTIQCYFDDFWRGLFQVMMVVAAMGMRFAGIMKEFGNVGNAFSCVVSWCVRCHMGLKIVYTVQSWYF